MSSTTSVITLTVILCHLLPQLWVVFLLQAALPGMVYVDSHEALSLSLIWPFAKGSLTSLHGAGGWLTETRRSRRSRRARHTRNSCHPWRALLTIPAIPPIAGRTWVTWNTQKGATWTREYSRLQTQKALDACRPAVCT